MSAFKDPSEKFFKGGCVLFSPSQLESALKHLSTFKGKQKNTL
jgi:hypothetical protein